jgi:hypothetical protein
MAIGGDDSQTEQQDVDEVRQFRLQIILFCRYLNLMKLVIRIIA